MEYVNLNDFIFKQLLVFNVVKKFKKLCKCKVDFDVVFKLKKEKVEECYCVDSYEIIEEIKGEIVSVYEGLGVLIFLRCVELIKELYEFNGKIGGFDIIKDYVILFSGCVCFYNIFVNDVLIFYCKIYINCYLECNKFIYNKDKIVFCVRCVICGRRFKGEDDGEGCVKFNLIYVIIIECGKRIICVMCSGIYV